MKNIIYCFTGTGNSFQAAEEIAKTLGDTGVYPMVEENGIALKQQKFDRVGIVFPVYFGGLPQQVAEFLQKLDFGRNTDSYLFAIGTYGRMPANAIRQMGALLKGKANIDYGRFIQMPDNYILMYDSGKDHSKVQRKYTERVKGIAQEIAGTVHRPAKRSIGVVNRYNGWMLKKLPAKAAGYRVSNACTGCGVCRNICPVENISMQGGTPSFGGNCQSCVGCIQYCPQKALNYREKTEKRGRYQNPQYTAQDLIEYQHRRWSTGDKGRLL